MIHPGGPHPVDLRAAPPGTPGRAAREWLALRIVLAILDATLLGLALASANVLRLQLEGLNPFELTPGHHSLVSLLILPALLVLFSMHGAYDRDAILAGTHEYAVVANATTYGVLGVVAASYFVGEPQFVSRMWLLLMWGLGIGFVCVGRFAARRVVRRLRRHGRLRTRVAIVGASSYGVSIAEQLRAAEGEGLDVVGFLDEYTPLGHVLLDGIQVIGRPDDLSRDAMAQIADEYILIPQALPHQRQEELAELMAWRRTPVLRIAVSSTDLLTHGVRVAERGNVPLVAVRCARLNGFESVWKRSFDLVGATVALVLLAPAVAVVMLRAAGKDRLLQQYAIRDATNNGRIWLFEKDVVSWPLLRGAPALMSVLTGQLSLVGPRPVLCDSAVPAVWHASGLTAIKPGLTGPWRLSGPAASLTEQSLRDLSYVRNYSIWEDLRIVWQSLRRLNRERLAISLARWDYVPQPATPLSLRRPT